jgi:hypothetical protein
LTMLDKEFNLMMKDSAQRVTIQVL